MGIATWILVCLCTILYLAPEGSTDEYMHLVHHYSHDGMSNADRDIIAKLMQELIKDMRLKFKQIFAIRSYHINKIGYEVGIVFGKTREKYRRMMDIYRELVERRRGRNQMYPPGIWWNRPFHWIVGMEQLKGLEMEIEKQMHVLQIIPQESLDSETNTLGEMKAQAKLDSTAPLTPEFTSLRQGAASTFNSTLTVPRATPLPHEDDEDLKRSYRETYEKEHKDKDKEWTLDKYYGFV